MSGVEEALLELLRPMIARSVREEVKRARLEERWVPVSEAARRLALSENAVRHRVRRGQLPGRNANGKVFVDFLELAKRFEQLP